MSFARYEAYKESGVDWLGDVPRGWTVCALAYRYEVQLGKMLDEKRITGERLAPYLRNVDVQWGRINVVDLPEMDFHDDDVVRFSLKADDLLVCEGGEVGRAAIWSGEVNSCFYQKALHRLRPVRAQTDTTRFAFYLMLAAAKLLVFSGSEGKATIVHLPAETLRRYRFAFPPLSEQIAIAAFLDHETAKIDALVDEQLRLIELLKEKRQAVISRAVTKGLDTSVAMKDSGIGWLGEVPAHWELRRIKHVTASFEQGWSPQCEGYPVETNSEWGVLKVGCVNGGVFDPTENKALPVDLSALPELGARAGDVLISRANTRELVGSVAAVGRDHRNLLICDKLYRVRMLPTQCLPEFVSYFLGSSAARGQIEIAATGASSSMLNIGQSTILDLPIPLPPVAEQFAIVAHLHREIATMDLLSNEAQSAIAVLHERRSALISAAVTGKIDVRGFVPDRAEAA